jgi:hypothetical protein
MINFQIINSDLIAFLEKCACNGVVLVTSTEKTKRNFFNYFYMDVVKGADEEHNGYIVVKAVDSEEKRMFIRHFLNEVEVETGGRFAVTDVSLLLTVLKQIPTRRKIQFSQEKKGTMLQIKTTDKGTFYGYDIRQENPSEELEMSLTGSTNGVSDWDSFHSFEEGIPKITIPDKGSALYNTVIDFDKMELTKVVNISTRLTKDQDLKFSINKNKVTISSGKKKENIQSKMDLIKEVKNPVEVKEKIITNLHPIVDHLFITATLYCRLAGDGALKYWLQSSDGNIELNFCSGSL